MPRPPVRSVAPALFAVLSFLLGCVDEDPAADAGLPDASSADGGIIQDTAAAAAMGLPCEVVAVLKARCQVCHTMPPRMGAPVPLLTYADTQRLAEGGTVKVWQRMKEYVETDFMPLAGSPDGPLTAAEKTTLLGWLGAGAQPGTAVCP